MNSVSDPNMTVKKLALENSSAQLPTATATTATSVITTPVIVAVTVISTVVIAAVLGAVLGTTLKSNKKSTSTSNKSTIDNSYINSNDAWTEPYEKSQNFVSNLNLTEKVNLLYGTENCHFTNEEEKSSKCVGQLDAFSNDKVSFPGMCLQDGPQGIRQNAGTSISWHASINTAATFNKTLIYEIGKTQGEECKSKGINTFLSPSVNIMRTPQAGRLWEGYGEDPFLVGTCATQIAKGIQDAGVIATIKHFAGNDQETYRKNSSSNIGDQALYDIYLEPFYRAVKEANVGAFMCAFNSFNGTTSCENKYLLETVLRDFLGFKGFIMSDWWAIKSNTTNNINSGMDVNMPGGQAWGTEYYNRNGSYWANFTTAVQNGVIKEERVNEAVTRVLASMYLLNQMENYPKKALRKDVVTDQTIALQRQAATESQVLLKNDGTLPISSEIKKIAIIGNAAFPRDCIDGDGDHQCYNNTNHVSNGHIPIGYGSGTTDFKYLIDPVKGITELAEKKGVTVVSTGNLIYHDEQLEIYGTTYTTHTSAEENITEDVNFVKDNDPDLVIVYVCAVSGEKYLSLESSKGDRIDLDAIHNGNELVNQISALGKKVVVVINAPAVINVPWLDNVNAVVFSGFPGMESGNAIADILFGEKNPSGHLPYVWGELKDYGIPIITPNDGDDHTDGLENYNYDEGLYVGQRHFNKENIKPTFPFGYGLSYTTFSYTDLKLTLNKTGLYATFIVSNDGKVDGSAVPMMFLTFPKYIGDYPEYILKGFEKVEIKSGENKEVTIFADDHALSYYDVSKKNYSRVNQGNIKVFIAENGDKDQAKLSGQISASY